MINILFLTRNENITLKAKDRNRKPKLKLGLNKTHVLVLPQIICGQPSLAHLEGTDRETQDISTLVQ